MEKMVKVVAPMLAAVMSLSLLAACGQKEAPKPAAVPASSEAPKKSPEAQKKVTLKFATWDYTQMPATRDSVEAFNKENPNTQVEPLDIASKEYPDKMSIMLAAGEDVDVYSIKNMADFSGYVQKKNIYAVEELVKKDGIDLKPYTSILDNLKVDGKLQALPYRSDFWLLFYNKDIFDKAKVEYPKDDMTWQQFRETAKKLTSGEGKDKVWGAFFMTWPSIPSNMLVSKKEHTTVEGKYDWMKPAYELMLAMQNEDKSVMPFAEAKTSNAHYKAMFESGKVGMHVMGSWHIEQLITDKKGGKHNVNWGIAKTPIWPGMKPGTTVGGLTGIGINSKTKNLDASWKFIKHITGEKGAAIHSKYAQMPAYRTAEIVNTLVKVEGFPAGYEKALETADVVIETPAHPKGAAIGKILDEENQLIMTMQKKLDQGLADIEKRVKEALAAN